MVERLWLYQMLLRGQDEIHEIFTRFNPIKIIRDPDKANFLGLGAGAILKRLKVNGW